MKAKFKVDGMTCGHCSMTVENAALALGFVKKAKVNLRKGELSFVMDEREGTIDAVKEAVRDAGYVPA